MEYPLISEYIEVIKTPGDYFEELVYLRPVLDSDGNPVYSGGNFAAVFKMVDEKTGKNYAVKCFLRDQERRTESYRLISEELSKVDSPYLTTIRYLEDELYVKSRATVDTQFPVLLMDWVDGVNLNDYIKANLRNRFALNILSYRFSLLAKWLIEQPFAHGDLKPDNILIRKDGSIVLVDYDGMFFPAMAGQKARELGSPDFRHPLRNENDFDKHIDDLAISSILLSIKAIAKSPGLMDDFGTGDRLLFKEMDYRSYNDSIVFNRLKLLSEGESVARLKPLIALLEIAIIQKYLSPKDYDIILSTLPTTINRIPMGHETFTIPDGFKTIGNMCAYHNELLREIHIPDSVTEIKESAFYKCISLSNIIIPQKVDTIERDAFSDCTSLKSVTLPDSLKIIGVNAFSGCKSLITITIPNTVISIGSGAFEDCKSLTEISIPDGVEKICSSSFAGCSSLKKIIIPESVSVIEWNAFKDCKSLIDIKLPDNLCKIGGGAFWGCKSLTRISIPKSTTEIGSNIFADCDSLKTIYFHNNKGPRINSSIFSGPDYLKRVKIYIPQGSRKYYYFCDSILFEGNEQSYRTEDGKIMHNGHEYVDLGLSVKWATCNLGASMPEIYGDKFGWSSEYDSGFSLINRFSGNKKYVLKEANSLSLSSINNMGDMIGLRRARLSSIPAHGTVAYKQYLSRMSTIFITDDIANKKWGGNWHIPSALDFEELINNCTWEMVNQKGIAGCKITSKKRGYTNRFIFIPADNYWSNNYNTHPFECALLLWLWSFSNNINQVMTTVFEINDCQLLLQNVYIRPVCKI